MVNPNPPFSDFPDHILFKIIKDLPLADALALQSTDQQMQQNLYSGPLFRQIRQEQANRVDAFIQTVLSEKSYQVALDPASKDPDIQQFLRHYPTDRLRQFKDELLESPNLTVLLTKLKTYRTALTLFIAKLDYINPNEESLIIKEINQLPYLFVWLDEILEAFKGAVNDSSTDYAKTLSQALTLLYQQGGNQLVEEALSHWIQQDEDDEIITKALDLMINKLSLSEQLSLLEMVLTLTSDQNFINYVEETLTKLIQDEFDNALQIAELLHQIDDENYKMYVRLSRQLLTTLMTNEKFDEVEAIIYRNLIDLFPEGKVGPLTITNLIEAFKDVHVLNSKVKQLGNLRDHLPLNLKATNFADLEDEIDDLQLYPHHMTQIKSINATFSLYQWLAIAIFKHQGSEKGFEFITEQQLLEPSLIAWMIEQIQAENGHLAALLDFTKLVHLFPIDSDSSFIQQQIIAIFDGLSLQETAHLIQEFIINSPAHLSRNMQAYLLHFIEQQFKIGQHNLPFYVLSIASLRETFLYHQLIKNRESVNRQLLERIQKGKTVNLEAKFLTHVLQEAYPILWDNKDFARQAIFDQFLLANLVKDKQVHLFLIKDAVNPILENLKIPLNSLHDRIVLERFLFQIVSSELFQNLSNEDLEHIDLKELLKVSLSHHFNYPVLLALMAKMQTIESNQVLAFSTSIFAQTSLTDEDLVKMYQLMANLQPHLRDSLQRELFFHIVHQLPARLKSFLINISNVATNPPKFLLAQLRFLYQIGYTQTVQDLLSYLIHSSYQALTQKILNYLVQKSNKNSAAFLEQFDRYHPLLIELLRQPIPQLSQIKKMADELEDVDFKGIIIEELEALTKQISSLKRKKPDSFDDQHIQKKPKK